MATVKDWSIYPNFSAYEFDCSHTGLNEMQTEFMDILQTIRTEYGKPMIVTSGYRHYTHPIEKAKGHKQGEHTKGVCADIAVSRGDAYEVLRLAFKHGIKRVGVNQKGEGRFLHLGLGTPNLLTPTIWSY